MSEDEGMNITDDEYVLIRRHLSERMAVFFDGLKESGARLGESIDGSKTPYIQSWNRAVEKAQANGLTRRPRIHDLRAEFRRRILNMYK